MKLIFSALGAVSIYILAFASHIFGFHFCVDEVIAISMGIPILSYGIPWLQSKGFFLKKSSCPCGHDDNGAHGH